MPLKKYKSTKFKTKTSKYDTIVEPLIGTTVPIPKNLWEIIQKPSYAKEIGRNYKELF